MADRTYDLVLYGATGFTGRLVAAHVRARAVPGLRWAIAGRSKARLQQVAEDLDLDVPVVIADAGDLGSLADMAEKTAVVCTTVGPYARYGSGLVEACVNAGTDYCDLTGEVQWMRRMIDAHQDKAEDSGAHVLHACGFDSIPSDVGTFFIQRQMRTRYGVPATHVRGRLKAVRGGISGGTLSSGLNLLEEAAADPDVWAIMGDPHALDPAGHPRGGSAGTSRTLPGYEDAFGAWAAPFVMAATNVPVVQRTNALLDDAWGTDFTYDEALLTGSGPLGALAATGLAVGLEVGTQVARRVGVVRTLLRRVLPAPGTGPSPRAQERGFFDFRLHAEHPTDPSLSLSARVVGDRDPGYGSTARMLGETALALAAGEASVDGGFWTPASALGDTLLERLPVHAGVAFDIIG